MSDTPTIIYPSADSLDSGDWSADSGYSVSLYLLPAEETKSGSVEIYAYSGVGNIGTPMPAFHGRWFGFGSYGVNVCGQSVLDVLKGMESQLLAVATHYEGTRWDGRNHVGVWADEDDLGVGRSRHQLYWSWCDAEDRLRSYWDAIDWFGHASIWWPELCLEAGIDPERALGSDWEQVAEHVGAVVEPLQDEAVSGTAAYAREMAKTYRSENLGDGQ